MPNIGVAVIGAGFIGPVHVEGLRRAELTVTGILGVDRAESESAKASLGLPRAYTSLGDVLADTDVQSVHIAVPNRLHFEMSKRALQAGKHVICEKPLAMNSRESAELVELAKKTGLVAGVNYNLRYYPLCIEAADMMRRESLGSVYSVCGSYVQDWLFYPTDYNWRVLAGEGGELRAVADIGTHWLDLVHTITGLEVESLCADLATFHKQRYRPKGEVRTFKGKDDEPVKVDLETIDIDTEDHGSIMLRFAGGARGVLWVSQVTAGRKNRLSFELAGSKCAISWCSESPNEMWIGHRSRPNEVMLRDPGAGVEGRRAVRQLPRRT